MNDEIRFEFDKSDRQGKRLVKALLGGELLTQERFDPLQSWQAKPFIDKVATAMPGTQRFECLADCAGFVANKFDEAIRNLSVVASTTEETSAPVLVRLCDVQPEPIVWLWPGRIALGKLTLFAGDPGLGKSFLSLDLAARVSTGTKWPDCDEQAPLGGSILLSAEDSLNDTIRPRLDAAGADVERIMALTSIAVGNGKPKERCVDLKRDLPQLEQAIRQVPDCRLVVVDPITAFLGKTDSHVNAEVREVLKPLADMADKYRVAVVAITHLNKGEGRAIYRATGSIAFAAACRSVLAITADKDDPTEARKLFLSVKSNIARKPNGLAFSLSQRFAVEGEPCVVWDAEPVSTSADDALRHDPQQRGPEPEALQDAADFLRLALADGPRLMKELTEEAREVHGISKRTLDRAKKLVRVKSYQETKPGPWFWRISNIANDGDNAPTPKQPGNLGNLAENSKETDGFETGDSNIAKLPMDGDFGRNGHDPDALNRLFDEAAETEPEG